MATAPVKAAPRRPPPPIVLDLDDFKESYNICIYGDPGAGKTPLAATLPNAMMTATEQGTISAFRYLKGKSDLKVTRAHDFAEFRRTFLWMRDVAIPEERYEWWIVDSVTKLQEMVLRHVLDEMYANNKHRDPDLPDKAEHQKWQVRFKKYVNAINDLPINVLWTAHTMRDVDEVGDVTVLPLLQGKNGTDDPKTMSIWFSGGVSLLGYLGIDEDEVAEAPNRRLLIKRTGDYSSYIVKDRFDLGVPYIDNPNLSEVYAMIKNGGTQAAPPRKSAPRRGQTNG